MLVETYEAIETGFDGSVECEAEAIALIDSLGLTGQQKLVNGDKTERFPYRLMTTEEAWVYGELLAKAVSLRDYSDGPIPLRVLRVASHAAPLFTKLVVWCPATPDMKDPVLVGIQGNDWDRKWFLLARWGEVLEPFADLMTKAANAFREKAVATYAEIAGKVQVLGELVKSAPASALIGKSLPTFYE